MLHVEMTVSSEWICNGVIVSRRNAHSPESPEHTEETY